MNLIILSFYDCSVLGEIKVGSGGVKPIQSSSSHGLSHGVVEAIKWDALEPGTLSVAIDSSIHDYDTKSGSRPVLVRVNHAKGGTRIRDFALYPGEDEKVIEASQSQTSPILDQLYSRRLMAILDDRKIYDMAKHNFAPVAISFRDGRLAHSLGGNLFVGDTTGGEFAAVNVSAHPCAISNANICDTFFGQRANCHGKIIHRLW